MAGRESGPHISEASLPEMIDELNSVLVPDEEIGRAREYTEKLQQLEAGRAEDRRKMETGIKALEASVSELRESSTRASADWRSLETHVAAMTELENEKFDMAKTINEQDAALSMLESEIEELRRESDAVENWDIEQEVEMDKKALSIQLFRGMGFLPYHDGADAEVPITSLVVRSARRNVAVTFDVDDKSLKEHGLTSYELASKLWAAAD
ncbi:hypothetical protein MSPP1_002381 [Malassezia sp. CBS 17886]|nr:hypothetical protein MSPP1_002381 [Malassezia sp. CBS 17886]